MSDANGTGSQDIIHVVSETSVGKVSVMRWARFQELNTSVDGEYAELVDETSGAVVPLQAGWK